MHTTHGSNYNVCSFIVQVSSVNRIPKPKPKVEKKTAKEEEPASKEKTTSSESAPNEGEYTETFQESKAQEEDQSASANTSDSEPESHDELWVPESIETGRKRLHYAYTTRRQFEDKFWLLKFSQFLFDDQKMRLRRVSRNIRCCRAKKISSVVSDHGVSYSPQMRSSGSGSRIALLYWTHLIFSNEECYI